MSATNQDTIGSLNRRLIGQYTGKWQFQYVTIVDFTKSLYNSLSFELQRKVKESIGAVFCAVTVISIRNRSSYILKAAAQRFNTS